MIKESKNLSAKQFQKMIRTNKRLPQISTYHKILKRAGMGSLYSGSRITKQQAEKAIKYLKGQKLLKTSKPAGKIIHEATSEQYKIDQAADWARKQKHIRANIALDVTAEALAEERGNRNVSYDPRSTLGKQSLADQLATEERKRQQEIKSEQEKRDKILHPKGLKPKKIALGDTSKLKEMGIDFGS